MELIPVNWKKRQTNNKITVIGVGGGGCNAVSYMFKEGLEGVDFIVCNTDRQALENSPVQDRLVIGEVVTKGLGTGYDPDKGRKAAEESAEEIKKCLGGSTEIVFITAGMGNGTGTGASPVIAEIAKSMGLLTIAVVTLPFRDEFNAAMERAINGIHELEKNIDSLLLIDNQKLYTQYENMPLDEAFQKANSVLYDAVKGISNIITQYGIVNVDLNDVRTTMKNSGMALMGIGTAEGENRAIEAAENAINSPLLSNCELSKAKGVLLNISTSGGDFALTTTEQLTISSYIREHTNAKIEKFKRGYNEDKNLGGKIQITVIVTGYNMMQLPNIPKEIINTEDTIEFAIDEYKDENGHSDLFDNDDYLNSSIKNNFKERYKDSPERPALAVEFGGSLKDLEKVPAYKRKGISLD